MPNAKIAISLEDNLLKEVDLLVKEKIYPNRSKMIQEAIKEKLNKISKNRLAVECSKLESDFEQALAEEGLSREIESWPEY
ncbi:ribbon-helix-helix protein, CopG family [candidate division KSB1 bacterium]|nr:ribbon-helix-helix protein, CopG family [candidate division KSB1 bacterium]